MFTSRSRCMRSPLLVVVAPCGPPDRCNLGRRRLGAPTSGVNMKKKSPRGTPCYFCGKRVLSGTISWGDQDQEPFTKRPILVASPSGGHRSVGAIRFPGSLAPGWKTIMYVAHDGCGIDEDSGYWMPTDRLEDPYLEEHIARKPWYTPGMVEDMRLVRSALGIVVKPRRDGQ